MRNLDQLNPPALHPANFCSLSALLPFMVGILCLPLAIAAAPALPFSKNPLAVGLASVSIVSFVFLLVGRFLRLDWRTKYFGISIFSIASTSLIGVIPWLGIVCFGNLSGAARLCVLAAYIGPLIWWTRRFVHYYRHVFARDELRRAIYEEDADAIYYLQEADRILIERRQLAQFPPTLFVVSSMILAFGSLPFTRNIYDLIGTPFPLIFFTIGTFPIALMCLGIAVRGFLIYYYYPWHLRRQTGKEVYVLLDPEIAINMELPNR